MPGTTPNHGYPFPLPTDDINVPRDIQALAMALDAEPAGVRLAVSGAASGVVVPSEGVGHLDWDSRSSDEMGAPGPNLVLTEPGVYLVSATIEGPVMPNNRFARLTLNGPGGPIAASVIAPDESSGTVSGMTVLGPSVNESLYVTVRNPHPSQDATFTGHFTAVRVAG